MSRSTSRAQSSGSARAIYAIPASRVSKVLCHRNQHGVEQYLVRWKTEPEVPVPPRAICSWHGLEELTNALHHVQTYVEALRNKPTASNSTNKSLGNTLNRKRKSPSDDPLSSRDSSVGLQSTRYFNREASSISIGSSSSSSDILVRTITTVYNGVLQRKEGKIVAKKSTHPSVTQFNATRLPTPQMLEEATVAPTFQAERIIRDAFSRKLSVVPNVRWENQIDGTAPSLNFNFISDFVLGDGVYRADPSAHVGCTKPCKPNMGQNIGCEYPRLCSCLEYAAVNEKVLQAESPERYYQYLQQKEEEGYFVDTTGLPKRFPYQKPSNANPLVPSILQTFYLESRYPIYECNLNCACGAVCKSRVVQKGRRVPLTIFKTSENRGWGVYCDEELLRGEFIDTYIGEVIANAEADRREQAAGKKNKASYLYSLDKFVGDGDVTTDNCYVVDGQFMGGPTRFINHSCEPNCRQYTVSLNKHDLRIYDLAFFAIEDIPAGTELTFDYMDYDEMEDNEVEQRREAAVREAAEQGEELKRCHCGAKKCRGYLWV